MTKTEQTSAARAELRNVGFSLRRVDGEWQIKPVEDRWDGDSTYYATDLADAVATGKHAARLLAHYAAVVEKRRGLTPLRGLESI